MNLPLPTQVRRLLRAAPELRETYLVGGCVRDALLQLPLADLDFEVFHLEPRDLVSVLRRFGRVDVVGRSFPVAKLRLGDLSLDFTVAGWNHPTANPPPLTPRLAAARRDFTFNALMLHTGTGELLDFFGGVDDLRRRQLRHVGPAFAEDPLRVLRGLQLAGRFDLIAAPETVALARSLLPCLPTLDPDRVREEWTKWATLSRRPSAGLRFLEASGWLAAVPELPLLLGFPGDSGSPGCGDVFASTLAALDALVEPHSWQTGSRTDRLVEIFATLTRDCGKAGSPSRSPADRASAHSDPTDAARERTDLAAQLLHRLHLPRSIIRRVLTRVAKTTPNATNPARPHPGDASRSAPPRSTSVPPAPAPLKTGSRPSLRHRRSPAPAANSKPRPGSRGPRPGTATS